MPSNRLRRLFFILKDLFIFTRARFISMRLLQISSSLTLTTLLSIVPLLAVVVAAFAVFPMFADTRLQIENAIFSSLLPEAYQDVIVAYLRRFSTHAGRLTVVGIAGFAVTAFLLISTVDATINHIFGAPKKRPIYKRIALYLSIFVLGPTVITSSSFLMTEIVIKTSLDRLFPAFVGIAIDLAVTTLAYALLYFLLSNVYVRFKCCLLGGLFVAVADRIAKWCFALYLASSPMGAVYGAFVALPIAMLWIYVTWTLILGGAAITASIPMLTCGRFADAHRKGNDFVTAVALLRELSLSQMSGAPERGVKSLCKAVDTYPQLAQVVLEKMRVKGLVKMRRRFLRSDRFELAMPADELTLVPVFELFAIDSRISLVADKTEPLHAWHEKIVTSRSLNMSFAELFGPSAKLRAA